MPKVSFTRNLKLHVDAPDAKHPGLTVREVLECYFAEHPNVRSYVLDDQGALRKHMVVFVDGEQVSDRQALSDTVSANAELYVMQALSGG